MGFQYYLFAFYIFLLVLVLMFLYNYYFSDIKRQKKLLDEKESKLLRLYQTLEDVLDEYYDTAATAKREISETMNEINLKSGELFEDIATFANETADRRVPMRRPVQVNMAPQSPPPVNVESVQTAPIQSNSEAPVIDFKAILQGSEENAQPSLRQKTTNQRIIELVQEGKSRAQIAQELNITQSEVDLVIGISGGTA